jgi:DNA-binding beta-propeller fold protein YncE
MSGLPFCGPTQVGVGPRDGYLYVADGYSTARVHEYTPDGKLLFSWGEPGTRPRQFCTVHKITVDSYGLVYVADHENQRVQVFDDTGTFLQQLVNLLSTPIIANPIRLSTCSKPTEVSAITGRVLATGLEIISAPAPAFSNRTAPSWARSATSQRASVSARDHAARHLC